MRYLDSKNVASTLLPIAEKHVTETDPKTEVEDSRPMSFASPFLLQMGDVFCKFTDVLVVSNPTSVSILAMDRNQNDCLLQMVIPDNQLDAVIDALTAARAAQTAKSRKKKFFSC